MADYTPFPAQMVTPEGVAFDGSVREIEVTSVSGGLGILARRSPVVADLKIGQVRLLDEAGTWHTWATAEGFAQASDSTATVVVEDAVPLDRIDVAAADELVSEGRARLAAAERDGQHEMEAEAARREIAWGEHLKAIAAQHA